MPATRVIVLEQVAEARPTLRVAYWLDVPAARQPFYANPQATSAWKDATAADLAALQTGAVVERVETVSADPPKTAVQMRAFAEARWVALQAEVAAHNPWARHGSTWDGTTWTPRGVA